jgi:integrase
MASVEDRWYRTIKGPDDTRTSVQSDRYGKGRRYRVHYIDPDGRQRSESFHDGEKRKAEKFAREVSTDVARGVYTDPAAGNITLRRYAIDIWFPAQTFGPSTRERVETRLRLHVLGAPDPGPGETPGLGSYRLAELSRRPSAIQAWLRGMQSAGMAPSTIRLVKGTLSTIFEAAIADELITKNPCRDRSVKAPRPVARKLVPWTTARVAAIRAGLPSIYAAMTDAGAGAGLRQGEVFGLSPDDVDWLRKIVHVRRQVKLVGSRRVFAPPKGNKERDVPLADVIALRLSAHLAAHPAMMVTLPWESPAGKPVTAALMFTKPDRGAIWRNDWNRYVWHPGLAAAGVTPGRENGFHQLRHHYASQLLADGVDIRALAEYLGHSDPGFTLRVYCHLLPSGADRARRAIDRAFAEGEDCPDIAQGGELRP